MMPNEHSTTKCKQEARQEEKAAERLAELIDKLIAQLANGESISEEENDELVSKMADVRGALHGAAARLMIYMGRDLGLDLMTSIRVLSLTMETVTALAYERHDAGGQDR